MRIILIVILGLIVFVACQVEDRFADDVDRGYMPATLPLPSPTHDLAGEIEQGYPETWTPTVDLQAALDQGYLATAAITATQGPSPTPTDPNKLADLVITYIRFDWAVDHSCGVEVIVTVWNGGSVRAGEFVLLVDEQELMIDGLDAKEQQTHQFSVDTGYLISFYADYYDAVPESNERNNNGLEALPYSDAIPGFVACPHRTPAATPTIPIIPT